MQRNTNKTMNIHKDLLQSSTMTISEFKNLVKSKKKKSKYGNQRTIIEGIPFDSKKEAARYCDLLLLQKAGKIRSLQLQVEFVLQSCYYFADFVYQEKVEVFLTHSGPMSIEWKTVVEDVKSPATRKDKMYRLKKKMMMDLHHIQIQEV